MESNTPTANAEKFLTHWVVAANFIAACEGLVSWVQQSDIKKEQVVAISAHESSIENGDAVLVLVYRQEQELGMASMQDLKFHLTKNIEEWDVHFKEDARIGSNQKDVVAYTHTPKNIGQLNISILWYLESAEQNIPLKVKHFVLNSEDYHLIIQEAMKYLNKFVQPHNLISFSFFEDDHPNSSQVYHAVVSHKGDDNSPLASRPDIIGDVYQVQLFDSECSQEELVEEACRFMEKRGTDQYRGTLATANLTRQKEGGAEGQIAVVMIYWNRTHEEALRDEQRGGCSCAMF